MIKTNIHTLNINVLSHRNQLSYNECDLYYGEYRPIPHDSMNPIHTNVKIKQLM
jgi:hypothetical protein